MTKIADTLTVDRLLRLRPSDIESIKDRIKSEEALSHVVYILCSYLIEVGDLKISDEDDLRCIVAQLNTTGLWKVITPNDLVVALHSRISDSAAHVLINSIKELSILPSPDIALTPSGSLALRSALSKLGLSPIKKDEEAPITVIKRVKIRVNRTQRVISSLALKQKTNSALVGSEPVTALHLGKLRKSKRSAPHRKTPKKHTHLGTD